VNIWLYEVMTTIQYLQSKNWGTKALSLPPGYTSGSSCWWQCGLWSV